MEQEFFFSGYCRVLDGSRMVTAVAESGVLSEIDCCYVHCPHTAECPIARQIGALCQP